MTHFSSVTHCSSVTPAPRCQQFSQHARTLKDKYHNRYRRSAVQLMKGMTGLVGWRSQTRPRSWRRGTCSPCGARAYAHCACSTTRTCPPLIPFPSPHPHHPCASPGNIPDPSMPFYNQLCPPHLPSSCFAIPCNAHTKAPCLCWEPEDGLADCTETMNFSLCSHSVTGRTPLIIAKPAN